MILGSLAWALHPNLSYALNVHVSSPVPEWSGFPGFTSNLICRLTFAWHSPDIQKDSLLSPAGSAHLDQTLWDCAWSGRCPPALSPTSACHPQPLMLLPDNPTLKATTLLLSHKAERQKVARKMHVCLSSVLTKQHRHGCFRSDPWTSTLWNSVS